MTTILCPVSLHRKRSPNAIALVTPDREYTYATLHEFIADKVVSLQQQGVTNGSRVALVSKNPLDLALKFWALMRMGAVACPVNPFFPDELIQTYLTKIKARLCYDQIDVVSHACSILRIKEVDVAVTSDEATVSIDLLQDATIIATSGTTSIPKAAVHTFGNHYYSALGSNQNIMVQPGDRWLLSLPLSHVSGIAILFRCWLAGAAVVVSDEQRDFCKFIERFGITHLSLVPTQLRRILSSENIVHTGRHLKAVLVGGAPVPEELIRDAFEKGLPIHTTYGLTEMSSQVCTTRANDSIKHLNTSGALLRYREMRVSESGELVVRGKTLCRGYADGGDVIDAVDEEGWFHTGDIGCVDANGYLTIAGRKDNLFISGGENIHPEEIERELMKLEGISEAIVVSKSDSEFGERPVAFIRFNNRGMTRKDLIEQLTRTLPQFKLPVVFYSWPENLKVNGLKSSRSEFRELVKENRAIALA